MSIACACPLCQEDLCLSLAVRIQDRQLFGAFGHDPAVAEIEHMIHRSLDAVTSSIRTENRPGWSVPSTPTGTFKVFRAATHRRSGPGSPPGWHQDAY